MTEKQAIEAIHAFPRMAPGGATLTRMRALLAKLGNPEKYLKCIQIAGTNGKGTLAAMTSSILSHAGYKTGLTISPYVLCFRERFQINGEMIPPRTLATLTQKVLDATTAMQAEGADQPVEFEVVTAVALLWFAREKCDFVVLETGLGGRYDATNAVTDTLVAAITKIGLDHTELLGDTIAEIAAEKAGIIKESCAVVVYPEQPQEAMGPILTAAADAHTAILVPELEDLRLLKGRRLENYIDYGGYRVLLPFPGRHQALHAAMAVEIALVLWKKYGYDISDEAIESGLREAKMPARIEVLRRYPLLLLDGCHNPDGTKALAETLEKAGYEDGSLVGVVGMLGDKNCDAMLADLTPLFAKAYTVAVASPRTLTAAELQAKAKFHFDAEAAADVEDALRRAIAYADENNLPGVVVCGSLYLAAEARPLLVREAKK